MSSKVHRIQHWKGRLEVLTIYHHKLEQENHHHHKVQPIYRKRKKRKERIKWIVRGNKVGHNSKDYGLTKTTTRYQPC